MTEIPLFFVIFTDMFCRSFLSLLLCMGTCVHTVRAQQDILSVAESEKASYQQLITSKRDKRSTPGNIDIVYHRLHLAPSLRNGYLKGSVFTRFKTLGTISVIDFDLQKNMTVDSVVYHHNTIAYTHNNDLLTIPLPGSLAAQQVDSVEVFYQGKPLYDQRSYEFSSHSDIPIIFTLSEPYGAHYWWPCKENLSDKIDSLDCFVLTDTGRLAAGNGLLVSSVPQNDSQILFHWQHRYPIATYLVAFAVTNYRQFTDYALVAKRTKQMPVLNYVYPESYNDAVVKAKAIINIIALYDSLFGTYPFSNEKYGHAQFNRNGGMEHQTMSFVGHFGFDLIAHELGHQWFGDKVTTGSWKDLWLNEGFATYLNMLCYRYLRTESEWQNILHTTRDNVMSDPGGSVFVTDTANVSRLFDARLTYNKGAMLLHMLRWKLGSDSFYSGLRNYLNDPAIRYGFSKTDLLKNHLEQVSGQNLTKFFNDWFYGEGYPTYLISWKQKGNTVSVTVKQKTSHPSVAYFAMPLEILFSDNAQATSVVLDVKDSAETFSFQMPFKVNTVTFDPNTWLLAKANILKEDYAELNAFDIYPNPVRDELVININKTQADDIVIVNMAGQTVYHKTYPDPLRTGQSEKLSLKNLASGVYLIEITNGDSVYKQKILKY